MSDKDDDKLIIESVTSAGHRFRPSDWIERLSTMLASFDAGHRLRYASEVQPCMIRGQKCLVVARELKKSNPDAFAYIMKFAADNELRIQEDRRVMDASVSVERRGQ